MFQINPTELGNKWDVLDGGKLNQMWIMEFHELKTSNSAQRKSDIYLIFALLLARLEADWWLILEVHDIWRHRGGKCLVLLWEVGLIYHIVIAWNSAFQM